MPRNKRNIANQRIRILYKLAQQTYPRDPGLSRRYTHLLMRIAQRTRTKLPRSIRRGICRNCKTILIPGLNSRTRIRQRREPHVTITCTDCGHITRIPLRNKQQ
ncbi:MAG: ribonuclease P [Candidatus Bathyarchaeota archaeon]|nr:ribonuclease P [Candidatus Bathyarchaeota archaeon]